MDNKPQGSKRVLRSTFAEKAKSSGSTAKRLKTRNRELKVLKGTVNRKEVNALETGNSESIASEAKDKKIRKRNSKLRSNTIWSYKAKHEYNIAISGDTSIGWITDCHLLDTGEIIFTDWYNKRLKKLDRSNQIVSSCDLPSLPVGMCYIRHYTVALSLGEKLHFADVTGGISLTRSVDIDFYCKGITCHDHYLYLVNENTVFIYTTEGKLERKVYTHDSREAYFQDIVVSEDGSKIYIASWTVGLVTIDSAGHHLYTLFDEDLKAPFGLCLDRYGNVLVCLTWLGIVLQVSSDGREKLGNVIENDDPVPSPTSLYFDIKTDSLIVGCGGSRFMHVVELF